jgi:diacylglycerol kinase (ATP)
MRVTLVHNSTAGSGIPSHPTLRAMLEEAGHDVFESKTLDAHLRTGAEAVIAAGGDGTALTVARELVGTDVPMVLLPVGTANNFGQSLGMTSSVEHLLSVLEHPMEKRIDLGVATGAWGTRHFCESAGIGWFSEAISTAVSENDKGLECARAKLAEHLRFYQPRHWDLSIDGRNMSGELVLLEVLNAGMVGPNLALGANADPSDGLLEVVIGTREDRPVLLEYLAALQRGQTPPPPPLHRRHARSLRIALGNRQLRVDGKNYPEEGKGPSPFAELGILRGAVKVWVPQDSAVGARAA